MATRLEQQQQQHEQEIKEIEKNYQEKIEVLCHSVFVNHAMCSHVQTYVMSYHVNI